MSKPAWALQLAALSLFGPYSDGFATPAPQELGASELVAVSHCQA